MRTKSDKHGKVNKDVKRKKKRKQRTPMEMRKRQLLNDNIKEDSIIANLEKSLKLKKHSACLSKSFCDDGLDFLLEPCDKLLVRNKDSNSKKAERSNKVKEKTIRSSRKEKAIEEESSSWKVDDIPMDDESSNPSDMESASEVTKEKESQEGKDQDTNRYLKLKFESGNDDKKFVILKRQIKGFLNRLAEANMHKIVTEFEGLYSSNSRNSVNKILVETVMSTLVSSVRTPERLVQETAMLISILQCNVDVSLGVHVIYSAAKQFHSLTEDHMDDDCKKLDNLVLLFSHLYNFKVTEDTLIYDIFNRLIGNFNEKNVELVLILLRSLGIALRKNSSSQLKELILKLQTKANEAKEVEHGSRINFLLDVVLAIKNNNVQKIPNYDPDHIEHLKKLIKSFQHPGKSITPIKLSLEDIIRAEDPGHLLINLTSGNISETKNENATEKPQDELNDSILKLSKKHRMNTDVRRRIFSVLVTAEDYMDAFEKIVQLHFKDQQEDEVMNLVLHCALQGKTYNPYYQFLACKLCSFNRKYKLSLQYSVWDKLEDLSSFKKECLNNLAKFVSNCIIEESLPLTSLKVLDLSLMNQSMIVFLKEVMLNIINNSSLETFKSICKKCCSANYAVFRGSLWLYVKHILCSSQEMDNHDQGNIKERLEVMRIIFGL